MAEDTPDIFRDTESRPPDWREAPAVPVIRGYQIVREIDRAGQGVVYQAIQESTKRKVAIKVLRDEAEASDVARQRFENEIELTAALQHPNIVTVFDSGLTDDGRRYYVMEYIRGERLSSYVRENKLTLVQALELFAAVCNAVNHFHERGVIHRDLKPSNILVDANGNVKVLDFGLAKRLAAPIDLLKSITGELLGTLRYMAPEQLHGRSGAIDVRTDVYALGVILYEILTGKDPYPVTDKIDELLEHIRETPPTPPEKAWDSTSGIPNFQAGEVSLKACPIDRPLSTIVLKNLSKERERRYGNAGDLARDIGHYLNGEPIEAHGDGLPYILWTRFRTLCRRHAYASTVGAVLFSTLVSATIAVPLVFHGTSANEFFEHCITTAVPVFHQDNPMNQVRTVALTDQTGVTDLAEREGLSDVSTENPKSLRRLHGALMKRLALAQCKAVVWAISFAGETEFDEAFVEGVRALQGAGVDVVVATKSWWLGDDGIPPISRCIAEATRWGCSSARVDPEADVPFYVQLVARRGWKDPLPSLALAAMAACREPGKSIRFELDAARESVILSYWGEGAEISQAKSWVPGRSVVELTALIDRASAASRGFADAFAEQLGLDDDDEIGVLLYDVAAENVLQASTIEYGQVMTADRQQLRRWFADKAVVIGDFRSMIPKYPSQDGREFFGGHLEASALDTLFRRVFVRMPRLFGQVALPLVGALLGCFAGLLFAKRTAARWGAEGTAVAVFVLGSVIAYWQFQYLFNPLIPIVALSLAAPASAWVRRLCIHRPQK